MDHLNNNAGQPSFDLDRASKLILKATQKDPKSAVELSKRYGIPIAKCFRKIKRLQEIGFIREAKEVLTKEGKEVSLYEADQDGDLFSSTNAQSKAKT